MRYSRVEVPFYFLVERVVGVNADGGADPTGLSEGWKGGWSILTRTKGNAMAGVVMVLLQLMQTIG